MNWKKKKYKHTNNHRDKMRVCFDSCMDVNYLLSAQAGPHKFQKTTMQTTQKCKHVWQVGGKNKISIWYY